MSNENWIYTVPASDLSNSDLLWAVEYCYKDSMWCTISEELTIEERIKILKAECKKRQIFDVADLDENKEA